MKNPLRLLQIEDSESDAALIQRLLERAGCEVHTKRVDDAQAVRAALSNGDVWDLIISDYRMPGFTAPDALRILQETGKDIPFIVVSGTIGEALAVELMRAGAHDYLMKDNLMRLSLTVEREVRDAEVRHARKRAEQSLRESEARLKLALTAVGMGVWEWNLVNNEVFWSPECYEFFQLPEFSNSLESFISMVHPEDRQLVIESSRRAIEEKTIFSSEFRIIDAKGSKRWVSNFGCAIYDEAGRPLHMTGTVKDITREREAREALSQSRAMLESVVGSALDGVIVMDSSGEVVLWNLSAERMFGYAEAEALGKRLHDLASAKEQENFERRFDAFFGSGGGPVVGQTMEFTASRKDGTEFPVELSVAPVALSNTWHAVGVVRDISERKKSEAALRESEERWQFALEGSGDGVWDFDAVTNTTYFSRHWKAMLGYEDDEISTRPEEFENRLHPDDRPKAMEAMAGHLSGRIPIYSCEYRLRCKDGSYKWILGRGKAISRDANGVAQRVIGTHADMTVLKKAEAEREALHAQFLQAQKMESIGRLAGGVAHDFNNLLTVINGYSAITLRRLEAGHPSRDSLEEIQRAGERATALVQQLLAFSRKDSAKPELLDLNELIAGMIRMAGCLIGEDVRLTTRLKPGLGQVKADRHQIEQVIMNLMVNTRDAMPKGGTVTLETDQMIVKDGCPECKGEIKAGTYVRLVVSDTGTGMAEEIRRKVFEPFFTTKEVGKGTGLGLSVVHGIIHQSEGHVGLDSIPGVGSAFHIYLPRVASAAPAEEPSSKEEHPGAETILVVEDEIEVRKYVATVLESCGYQVWQAQDGPNALTRLAEAKPDLLLTDVSMPKMSGRDLASRARKIYPGLKVLLMSGFSGRTEPKRNDLPDSAAFLQKPFNPHSLAAKVHEMLSADPQARILIVDDEPGVRKYIASVLTDAGYRVSEAANGKQALAEIRKSKPDLVITDLVMPEQEGIETIGILRRDHPEIRVIAISGAAAGKYLDMAKPLGADASLSKPVKPETLLDEVRRVLEA